MISLLQIRALAFIFYVWSKIILTCIFSICFGFTFIVKVSGHKVRIQFL